MGNSLDCSGRQAFLAAVERGNLMMVKSQIERIGGLDFVDEKTGYTPLHMASVVGTGDYFEIAKLLIQSGAPIDKEDLKGQSCLFLASLGGHLDLVKMLLDHGADVNRETKEGYTPFYVACWRNRLEVAKLLLKLGAEYNHVAPDGNNALTIAKEWNSDAVVEFLENGDFKFQTIALGDPDDIEASPHKK
mmetsp:Transcript_28982/g.70676  ORF Transcript_28982/g.70676 Transcript_28982/m.70676 type:complete len:190 (-) Transcript_28982:233-802(-)